MSSFLTYVKGSPFKGSPLRMSSGCSEKVRYSAGVSSGLQTEMSICRRVSVFM